MLIEAAGAYVCVSRFRFDESVGFIDSCSVNQLAGTTNGEVHCGLGCLADKAIGLAVPGNYLGA